MGMTVSACERVYVATELVWEKWEMTNSEVQDLAVFLKDGILIRYGANMTILGH